MKTCTPLKDWKSDWSHQLSHGVYAARRGEYVRIGNRWLERVFRVSRDVLRTVQLVNKVSGREPPSQEGHEFTLELAGAVSGEVSAQDFELTGIALSSGDDQGLRVDFHLRGRRHAGLRVNLVVETYPEYKYQRKWLTVHWTGLGSVSLNRADIEVIRFGWWYHENPSHHGYGQPVFVSDLFLGLEYPGAETHPFWLRHHPGCSLERPYETKKAVWGVAPGRDHVRRAFFEDYLDTIVPMRPRPFVIYNLIGAGIPEDKLLCRSVEAIGREARKADFAIDAFAIDAPWHDQSSIWQPAPLQFPERFRNLNAAIRSVDGKIGLWMSLCGSTLDTRWGEILGVEVAKRENRGEEQACDHVEGHYCLSGPKYRGQLKVMLERYLRDDGCSYFKFDYNVFGGCIDPTHGHPVGRAAKDADIDACIDILQHVKKIAPDTRIAITTGLWLSPWWLCYTDFVWMGGNDVGTTQEVPCLTPHDSAMTYRDAVLYQDLQVDRCVFPSAAIMTHGFWVPRGTPYPQFQDDAVMTIGRGIAKWEILTSPQEMDARRYAFLGRVIRWGKANWGILSQTEMILGNPRKGEVYGYRHIGEGAILLFLRNPAIQSRTVTLSIDQIGLATEHVGTKAFAIYPAREEMEWSLGDGRQFSVEVPGCRCLCLGFVWNDAVASRVSNM
jgi:hypothetical protein